MSRSYVAKTCRKPAISCLLGLLLFACSEDPLPDSGSSQQRASVQPPPALLAANAGAAALPVQTAQPMASSSMPAAAPPSVTQPGASGPAVQPEVPASMQPSAAEGDADTWPADCKERFVFHAHGQPNSGDSGKYSIEPGAERQVLFYFRSPWKVNALQLLQARERIDNPRVVHHWMLYTIENDTVHNDAEILEDLSQQSLVALLTQQSLLGGIPGGGDVTLPEGVGLHLPNDRNVVYALSIHYMNITASPQADASGVEVCVSDQKREADAATHWLGKLSFELPAHAQTDVRSTCTPTASGGPAHIIATTPHMHGYGRRATLNIKRASGAGFTLLDAPYEFAEQRVYDVFGTHSADELLLNQGDEIDVTCSFDNTSDSVVRYGESLHDEMCFMSILAWPVGSLANHAPFARVAGLSEDQSCLEP